MDPGLPAFLGYVLPPTNAPRAKPRKLKPALSSGAPARRALRDLPGIGTVAGEPRGGMRAEVAALSTLEGDPSTPVDLHDPETKRHKDVIARAKQRFRKARMPTSRLARKA